MSLAVTAHGACTGEYFASDGEIFHTWSVGHIERCEDVEDAGAWQLPVSRIKVKKRNKTLLIPLYI